MVVVFILNTTNSVTLNIQAGTSVFAIVGQRTKGHTWELCISRDIPGGGGGGMSESSPYWWRFITGWFSLGLLRISGTVLNVIAAPGFVRECDYEAGICEANIKVHISPLFTTITVNGLDIYFSRLSGIIDGVGMSTSQPRTEPVD